MSEHLKISYLVLCSNTVNLDVFDGSYVNYYKNTKLCIPLLTLGVHTYRVVY